MEYKREQTTTMLRCKNSIRSYKILDVRENRLIVRNPLNKNGTVEVPVSEPDNYKAGDYVDLVFIRMGSNSHRIELIGHTPPEFSPNNRIDVF